MVDKLVWTQNDAIKMCREIEKICPKYGCHIALTGGTLYKDSNRKDADILFYRIRQIEKIDMDGLWIELSSIGLSIIKGFGWCYKAEFNGKPVDCFFPEEQNGEYHQESMADELQFLEINT